MIGTTVCFKFVLFSVSFAADLSPYIHKEVKILNSCCTCRRIAFSLPRTNCHASYESHVCIGGLDKAICNMTDIALSLEGKLAVYCAIRLRCLSKTTFATICVVSGNAEAFRVLSENSLRSRSVAKEWLFWALAQARLNSCLLSKSGSQSERGQRARLLQVLGDLARDVPQLPGRSRAA